MDTMDKFTVSANPFDHILTVCKCDNGVWISVKGSSMLELWDHQQLTCKMLYDIKENKHPTLKKVKYVVPVHLADKRNGLLK